MQVHEGLRVTTAGITQLMRNIHVDFQQETQLISIATKTTDLKKKKKRNRQA